jgi:hypothetical protein
MIFQEAIPHFRDSLLNYVLNPISTHFSPRASKGWGILSLLEFLAVLRLKIPTKKVFSPFQLEGG